MAAISNSFFGGLDIESLVDQFRQIELGPRSRIEFKQSGLESRKQALNDLDSKLSTLFTLGQRFEDIILNVFNSKTAESSDSALFTVTAGTDAQLGAHSLTVSRLASIDTRVSKQYVSTDSDFGAIVTDQSFGIVVAHPTDADPDNTVEITVTISAATFSQTNSEVLADVASAINEAMSVAATAETIDSDEAAVATVVTEASGQSRLVLRSGQSGETNALTFNDTDGLLATLETNANVQSSGTSGRFITVASDLSALFTLDGLTFTRDNNFVEDALEGVGLQLLDTTSTTESLTITADTEAVKAELQSFIDAYNEVAKLLKTESAAGGEFRGDTTYSTMRFKLRSLVSSLVSSAESTAFDQLIEIGIGINRDGTLFFDDESAFDSAVSTNPQLIKDIFTSTDGITVTLNDFIINFTKSSGIIDSSTNSIAASLRRQTTRLEAFDDRLENRVQKFRNDLIRLQAVMVEVQSQSGFLSNFSNFSF